MMITRELIDSLTRTVGEENVLTKPADLAAYSMDASTLRGKPGAVVFPRSEEDAANILEVAHEQGVSVVPRGAGTGICGGTVPAEEGSIVMVSTRMNRILDLKPSSKTVFVEPGVVLGDLNEFLLGHGLFFPIEPACDSVCTVGGRAATDAGGLRGVKYGSFRRWVSYLEVALPGGEILRVGGSTARRPSGYSLIDLFVGSEGTLGFFVKLGLRVEWLPKSRRIVLASFPGGESAARAARDIIVTGLKPSALEYMDRLTIEAVEEHLPEGVSSAHDLLLVEFEGYTAAEASAQVKKASRIIENFGGGVKALEDGSKIWAFRKACLPALMVLRPRVIPLEVTVPFGRVAEALEAFSKVGVELGFDLAVFGHLGDGVLYPTLLFDASSGDAERVEEATKLIAEAGIRLAGSLSGGHGVGIRKRPYFSLEHPRRNVDLMGRLKGVFDPRGIMNPGKIWG